MAIHGSSAADFHKAKWRATKPITSYSTAMLVEEAEEEEEEEEEGFHNHRISQLQKTCLFSKYNLLPLSVADFIVSWLSIASVTW